MGLCPLLKTVQQPADVALFVIWTLVDGCLTVSHTKSLIFIMNEHFQYCYLKIITSLRLRNGTAVIYEEFHYNSHSNIVLLWSSAVWLNFFKWYWHPTIHFFISPRTISSHHGFIQYLKEINLLFNVRIRRLEFHLYFFRFFFI